MHEDEDGTWSTQVSDAPQLMSFSSFDYVPYMFRVTKDDWLVAYRIDLYSRCQIGNGDVDPEMEPSWSGRRHDLDGSKSCSLVIDPERVTELFAMRFGQRAGGCQRMRSGKTNSIRIGLCRHVSKIS